MKKKAESKDTSDSKKIGAIILAVKALGLRIEETKACGERVRN